jgi:uncharacterized protein (UPF0333 family)
MRFRAGQMTLEVLIALAVLTVAISAIVIVVMSNQYTASFSERQHQALRLAQQSIESARAFSQQNFDALSSSTTTNDIFHVVLSTQNVDDYTKRVTSTVSWNAFPGRTSSVYLEGLITNWRALPPDDGTGGGSNPTGDWQNPFTAGTVDLGAGNAGTDIAIKDSIVYMSAVASDNKKDDFFVVDVSNINAPTTIGHLDTGYGLNAIAAIGTYVFGAHDRTSKQLQVIDVSNPSSPRLMASTTLSDNNQKTISIFAKGTFVYIGTQTATGKEFQIYSVANPLNPQFVGAYEVGGNVNDIWVFNNRAYLAVGGIGTELIILDVSNPANPSLVSTFDCVNGCSESVTGQSVFAPTYNTVYLGTENQLVILNTSVITNITVKGKLSTNGGVIDLYARDTLAFLATNNSNQELQIVSIADQTNPTMYATFNFPQVATGIIYRDNVVYISVRSNDSLRIVTSR